MPDRLVQDALLFLTALDSVGTFAPFAGLTAGLGDTEWRRTVHHAVGYPAVILLVSALVGSLGVRLLLLQVVGSAILCLIGLQMLFAGASATSSGEPEVGRDLAVFPLAVPSIAGPGAIVATIVRTDNALYSWVEQLATEAVRGCRIGSEVQPRSTRSKSSLSASYIAEFRVGLVGLQVLSGPVTSRDKNRPQELVWVYFVAPRHDSRPVVTRIVVPMLYQPRPPARARTPSETVRRETRDGRPPPPVSVPTTSFVLRKQKAKADGEAPVWLRVTHQRRSRFYTETGVAVRPEDWDGRRKEVKRRHELSAAYNRRLEELRSRARAAALQASSAEEVVEALKRDGDGGGSLSAFLDRYVEQLRAADQVWERKKFETLRRKLTAALGWPVSWGSLTPTRLATFEAYLRRELGNSSNTVNAEFRRLRRVVNRAVFEGELDAAADPFLRYKMPSKGEVRRRWLSVEDVVKIVELGPGDGVPDGSRRAAVRDLFALQFYGSGLRVSDALRMTPENVVGVGGVRRLDYTMMKTNKRHRPKLPEVAWPLVDRLVRSVEARSPRERARFGRYLVPLLRPGRDGDPVDVRRRINSASAVANSTLKDLAKRAELDPAGLSTHVARRSFAELSRRRSGVYGARELLGHSTVAQTEEYLAGFDLDALDEASDAVWSDG